MAYSSDPRPRNPRSVFFRGLPPGWEEDRALFVEAQRERMLEAMTRAVAAKGYTKVTVSDVVALAGVSRRTFYEYFTDKEQCFLDACATGSLAIAAECASVVAHSGLEDWHERVRLGMSKYTELMAANPNLARALMVDVLGAGPRAVELRHKVFASFVDLYRPAPEGTRPADVAMRQVPEAFLVALVGGISELVQQHIVDRGAESLEELNPTLIELAFSIVELGARMGDRPRTAIAS